MTELIRFLEEVALLGLAFLAGLVVDLYRRVHNQAVELATIRSRLDSGEKRFGELREDIAAIRAGLQHVETQLARVVGLLEKGD